jgi:hypothetical protein
MSAIIGGLRGKRSRNTNVLVALSALVGVFWVRPAPAGAQSADSSMRGPSVGRWGVGAGLVYAQSVGELRRNVQGGIGFGGQAQFHLDPWGALGLRADFETVGYSQETQDAPLYGAGGWFSAQQQTSYNLVVASIGPELAVPLGPVRPYVNAAIGFVNFSTNTSIKAYDGTALGGWDDFSDYAHLKRLGGGFRIPLSTTIGQQSILVDVGARYNAGGRTRYLIKGDIVQDPNNPNRVIITPHESEARFWTYRLGAALTF